MIAQIQIRRGTTAEWAAANPVILAAGEQGYDTTLKRFKMGDGATAWASLPWSDYGNNLNILHNWDFRNPVNQRGMSGTISAVGYFFDRWKLNSGSVTVATGYLTIASGAEIEQRIEGLYLAGETVTVSVKVGTSYISGSGTFPTSAGTASVTLTGFGTATLGYNANYMFIRFTTDAARNLAACKCELGTVSTLAYDPPMDHASELLKCQRFFFLLGTKQRAYARFPNAVAVGSTNLGCFVQFPSRMRNIPTFYYTGSLSNYGTVTANNFTAIAMTDDGVSEGGAFIYFTTSGLTEGHVYSIRAFNSTNASLCFSADL